MPIKFLLPNSFELDIKDIIERQYIEMIRKHNQIYSIISGIVSAITFIAIFFYIPYARKNYSFMNKDQDAVLTVIIYLVLVVVMFTFGCICVNKGNIASEMPKPANDFQVKQTSFYIAVSNEKLEQLSKDYLRSKKTKSKLFFNHYNVYVDIYDETSGNTTRCFIGQMKNEQLMPVGNYNKYYKLATTDMITTINSYALYIKKHHIESEFADSATLRLSTKYLDKDYKPMLVMTNKSGKVLHLKQNSNINVDNVAFTN